MLLKILKYITLLLGVIFIVDRVLYYAIDTVHEKTLTGESGGKINDYMKQAITPTLLIMGPSSPTYQINPSSFEISTFNIGHANTEDAFQTSLLSIILQNNKQPKNILLYVNPYSYLDKDSSINFVSESPLKLKYYYSKNPLVTNYINELGIKEKIKFLFRLTCYNNYLINTIKNYFTTIKSGPIRNGYSALPYSDRDSIVVLLDYERSKMNNASLDSEDKIAISKMRYLVSFVNLCKANNINLILFTLPVYSDVVEGFKTDKATDNVTEFCEKNKLKFVDFRTEKLSSLINKPRYWKDIKHLNELGASIESKYVAESIFPFF